MFVGIYNKNTFSKRLNYWQRQNYPVDKNLGMKKIYFQLFTANISRCCPGISKRNYFFLILRQNVYICIFSFVCFWGRCRHNTINTYITVLLRFLWNLVHFFKILQNVRTKNNLPLFKFRIFWKEVTHKIYEILYTTNFQYGGFLTRI